MNRTVLVICDMDEKYCYRLDEYIREYLNISFEIVDYTDPDKLPDFDKKQETAVLLIGQGAFNKVGTAGFDRILVLDEMESINSDNATLDYPNSEIDQTDK